MGFFNVSDNYAGNNGGAFYFESNAKIEFKKILICNNKAEVNGGVFAI